MKRITSVVIALFAFFTGSGFYWAPDAPVQPIPEQDGIVNSLGSVTGGSGYTNGTYFAVPIDGTNGSGTGLLATVVVSGNAVSALYLENGGQNYAAGNTLSCSTSCTARIGAGSGFASSVSAIVSTTALTQAQMEAGTIDIRNYGAVCDGATDDGPATSTAFNVARTLGLGKLVGPSGKQCLLSTSVNATNLVSASGSAPSINANIAVDFGGVQFNCKTGSYPCFDFTGSKGIPIFNLGIWGSVTNTPTVGILFATPNPGPITASHNSINNARIAGRYTIASIADMGSEHLKIFGGLYSNIHPLPTSFVLAVDCNNSLGIQSLYVPSLWTANTGGTCVGISTYNSGFQQQATAGVVYSFDTLRAKGSGYTDGSYTAVPLDVATPASGGPESKGIVSGAANNGSGLVRLTVASTTGWSTGDTKYVYGVGGTTEANGSWTITVVDSTHIDLQGSSYSHAWTSGGVVVGGHGLTVDITVSGGAVTSAALNSGGSNYLDTTDFVCGPSCTAVIGGGSNFKLLTWQLANAPALYLNGAWLFSLDRDSYVSTNGPTAVYVLNGPVSGGNQVQSLSVKAHIETYQYLQNDITFAAYDSATPTFYGYESYEFNEQAFFSRTGVDFRGQYGNTAITGVILNGVDQTTQNYNSQVSSTSSDWGNYVGVATATVSNGGTGCTNGSQTFKLSGGKGQPATITGTVTAGVLGGALTVTTAGKYQVFPSDAASLYNVTCTTFPTVTLTQTAAATTYNPFTVSNGIVRNFGNTGINNPGTIASIIRYTGNNSSPALALQGISPVVPNLQSATGTLLCRNASDNKMSVCTDGSNTGTVTAKSGTAPPGSGACSAGYLMSSTANLGVFFGAGAPTCSAAQGSIYLRTDGAGATYINNNGSTGWTSK